MQTSSTVSRGGFGEGRERQQFSVLCWSSVALLGFVLVPLHGSPNSALGSHAGVFVVVMDGFYILLTPRDQNAHKDFGRGVKRRGCGRTHRGASTS
mmetsp:Transcript_65334/g.211639  ORF Transcript_65334/g.211639 Transcript_65334/m.211639 type:complete len:96 (-) Transcript_65334:2-289(-)